MGLHKAFWLSFIVTSFLLIAVSYTGEQLTAWAAVLDAPAKPVALPAYRITAERAIAIAQQATPQATLIGQAELVNLQGRAAYEVVLSSGKVYVDPTSGNILYNGATTTLAPGPVNLVTAMQIARRDQQNKGNLAPLIRARSVQTQERRLFEVTFADATRLYISPTTGEIVTVQTPSGS